MLLSSSRRTGTPILPDGEFDELKRSLKEADSPIAVSNEPKCYVDTGICTVTFQKDLWRGGILYVPAYLIAISVWLIGSYELLEPLRYVNPIISLGECEGLDRGDVTLICAPRR